MTEESVIILVACLLWLSIIVYNYMHSNNQPHPFIRVVGSGSTGCLLNSNCQDERTPIDLITGLSLASIHFSGQFALGKDH
jgi:hypothetical protein